MTVYRIYTDTTGITYRDCRRRYLSRSSCGLKIDVTSDNVSHNQHQSAAQCQHHSIYELSVLRAAFFVNLILNPILTL